MISEVIWDKIRAKLSCHEIISVKDAITREKVAWRDDIWKIKCR
jgi:hypothetical protein